MAEPPTAWCPFALKAPVSGYAAGFGGFVPGVPKIVHHTTEGGSYVGAWVTYRKTGALPHFTDSFEGGIYGLWQHLPIDVAASALRHPAHSGHTNRDNAIQVEHVGWTAMSSKWAPGYLDGIARLSRWIEAQTGCLPRAEGKFAAGAPRLDWQSWHMANGHLGHMHVPFNDHSDPGAMDIERVLAAPTPTPPPVVVTPFPGDHMRRLDMTERGLDGDGNGHTDLFEVPAFHVVSVEVNTAGHAVVPRCKGGEDFGGHHRLLWEGPKNAGAFAFRVWVAED